MHVIADHPLSDRATTPAPGLPAMQWLSAYQRVIAGDSQAEVLNAICQQLAAALECPLVLLCRRRSSGLISMEARSHEHSLWIELQRLPERWDGTVAGNGPASRALLSGHPAWMQTKDDGFLPWRRAAETEQVHSAGAWPMLVDGESWLLEVFAGSPDWFDDPSRQLRVEWLTAELARFLGDEARMRRNALLAAGLERAGNACFITDLDGTIIWSNRAFQHLSGYSEIEINGKNPRMLQSGRQGQRYYQDLWSRIRSGQVWSGETIDRDREGRAYTVRQTISPFGPGERIGHFLSVHEDISVHNDELRRSELSAPSDPISGLSTRASFEQTLESACRQADPFALIAVSLLALRQACATLGNEANELLSAAVGERIRDLWPDSRPACWASGGEILMLVSPLAPKQLENLLSDLRRVLLEPYPLIGEQPMTKYREAHLVNAESGVDPYALLRVLDRRMAMD